MKNKVKNKSDRKKLFILILLLFVVIGVSGYGAYSYFYTTGEFNASDTVEIASFDPEVSGDFLGHGGSIILTCPDSGLGNETVQCTGELEVTNYGGTNIVLSIPEGATASVNQYYKDAVQATAGTPSFSWGSGTTLSPDQSSTLTVTVPVTLSSCFGDFERACQRSEPYNEYEDEKEKVEVTVSFKVKAEQAH